MYRDSLKKYGLESRLASIRHIDTRPDLQALIEGKEEVVFGKLEEQGRTAIEQDGADLSIIGSTMKHQSHAYLSENLPVPVSNHRLVAYEMCEMFLDLGLTHSKRAYLKPENLQDENLFPTR